MVNWQYSESIESSEIVKIKKKYSNYIGGKFVEPSSKKYLNTVSPSTEEILSKVPLSNQKDIDNAVKAARSGFEKWSSITPYERSQYLFKIARLIQERSREFAVLESLDGGKPIKESRDFDLPQVAANFFYFAGWADKLDLIVECEGIKTLRCRWANYSLELPAINACLESGSSFSNWKYCCS